MQNLEQLVLNLLNEDGEGGGDVGGNTEGGVYGPGAVDNPNAQFSSDSYATGDARIPWVLGAYSRTGKVPTFSKKDRKNKKSRKLNTKYFRKFKKAKDV